MGRPAPCRAPEGGAAVSKNAVAKARKRLGLAIDAACIARGEALWITGYRACARAWGTNEDKRLFQKEIRQFEVYDKARKAAGRAIAAYARAVRETTR